MLFCYLDSLREFTAFTTSNLHKCVALHSYIKGKIVSCSATLVHLRRKLPDTQRPVQLVLLCVLNRRNPNAVIPLDLDLDDNILPSVLQ